MKIDAVQVVLFLYFPGPPKITLDTGTFQLYPISKRLCSEFDPDKDTRFELYTSNNIDNPTVLKINDEKALKSSHIDFQIPTVIFIHGFLESSRSPDSVAIKNSLLKSGNYNVILVDSERLLAGPFYINSASNVMPIGKYAAKFVDFLVGQGLKLSDLHVIGMSLGAHVAGALGRNLKTGKPAWITGLDPAGPLFSFLPQDVRLSNVSADFVDALHTNAGLFGILHPVGHVDIWFNGGHFQPGCEPISTTKRKPGSIGELVFCNHYQAWRLYVNTLLNNTQYEAVKCQNYHEYKLGRCNGNERISVGLDVSKSATGNYFIDTGVTAVDVE